MNRRELLETVARAEALAAVARELLKAEAEQEWTENDTRAVWDTSAGQAVASINQPGLDVQDEQALLRALRELWPTEVTEVTELRVRNPKWYAEIKGHLAQEILAGRVDGMPGTKLLEGGTFRTLSITINAATKRRLAAEAREMLMLGGVLIMAAPGPVVDLTPGE